MNMASFAFRYLLPAPWLVGIRTWEEILAYISYQDAGKEDDPLITLPVLSLGPGSGLFTYSTSRRTKPATDRHARQMLGFPALTVHSSSLESSSSSSVAFLVGFFFFFLFLPFAPVDRATGCSRIFRISSSVIFFSVLYCSKLGAGGALKRTIPFFVMAGFISLSFLTHLLISPKTYQLLSKVLRQEPSPCLLQPHTVGEHLIAHTLPHQLWPLFHPQAASS